MCADDVKMAVGRDYRGPGDGEHGVLVVDRGHTAEELEHVGVAADDAAGGGDPEVVDAQIVRRMVGGGATNEDRPGRAAVSSGRVLLVE
jgi:hypothetical protein